MRENIAGTKKKKPKKNIYFKNNALMKIKCDNRIFVETQTDTQRKNNICFMETKHYEIQPAKKT